VGPVTAAAVVATLDDVGRFASAGQVAAYIGLVPRERSSGEQQRRGPLTKTQLETLPYVELRRTWDEFDRLRRERARLKTLLKHPLYAVFYQVTRSVRGVMRRGGA
jgi:transposase